MTSDDEEFAEKVRQLKTFGYVYGKEVRVVSVGFNYRLTKAQAAVGLTQLAKIDRVTETRLRVFRRVDGLLAGVEEIIRPAGIEFGHGCHLYVARLDTDEVPFDREAFLQVLKRNYGVSCGNHYPAVWSWDAFAQQGYSESVANCPIAARACDQVFSLPLFPHTAGDDCEYIVWAIKQSLLEARR